MTLTEVKTAVDNGQKVYWKSNLYPIIKDRLDQYWCKCTSNGSVWHIETQDGKIIGDEGDYYEYFSRYAI